MRGRWSFTHGGTLSHASFVMTLVSCCAQGQSVEEARARQMELHPWRNPLPCVICNDIGVMLRAGAERGGGACAADGASPMEEASPMCHL